MTSRKDASNPICDAQDALSAPGGSHVGLDRMSMEPDVSPAPMDGREATLQRSIEAVLFVAGESLSLERLAKLVGVSHSETAAALQTIAEDYADRGVVLREVAGGYRFASAPAARDVVEAYLLPPKTTLSSAAMETLAIVAYLQPVTKADLEAVRGVNVDSVVSTLVDRRFIAEAGRREVVGRPTLYKITPEFLEAFGLRSLAELPPVDLETDGPDELVQAITAAREA